MPMTLEQAKRAIEGAKAKAAELGIRVSVVVVDVAGRVVALERMDGASWATTGVAEAMAFTSAAWRMRGADMTRWHGSPWFTSLVIQTGGKMLPAEGGMPIRVDREFLGAIGVSGGSGEQDRQCSEAGLAAIGAQV